MLGESPAAQKARIEEASKGANDLTGLVKKKKPAAGTSAPSSETKTVQSNGKRKANFDVQEEDAMMEKKARTKGLDK